MEDWQTNAYRTAFRSYEIILFFSIVKQRKDIDGIEMSKRDFQSPGVLSMMSAHKRNDFSTNSNFSLFGTVD
jgi:hypothetical protein